MKNDKKKNAKLEPPEKPGDQFAYPPSEDIYSRAEELEDIDPETFEPKVANEKRDASNEKDFTDDVSGSDLDVPGSELDDEQEKNGNEDEENNYYSLGDNNTKV